VIDLYQTRKPPDRFLPRIMPGPSWQGRRNAPLQTGFLRRFMRHGRGGGYGLPIVIPHPLTALVLQGKQAKQTAR
jgi:hypothetical protein